MCEMMESSICECRDSDPERTMRIQAPWEFAENLEKIIDFPPDRRRELKYCHLDQIGNCFL